MLRLVLWTCLLAAGTAFAQAKQDADDPGISVSVKPTGIPVNGTVTISGLGYPQPGVQLVLVVMSPAHVATTLNLVPDSNGRFQTPFSRTAVEGDYQISVSAGGKGAAAKSTFTARSYLIDIDEDVADNKDLLNESLDILKKARQQVDAMPDSPAKADLEKKLDPLESKAESLPQQNDALKNALGALKSMVSSNPQAAVVLQPAFDHLAQIAAEQKQSKEDVERSIKATQRTLNKCDTIDQATMALKAVPDMMSLLIKPLDFVASFAENIGKAAVKSRLPDGSAGAVDSAATAAHLAIDTAPGGQAATDAASKSIAKNGPGLGAESDIAARLVAAIPDSVKQSSAYKFVVAETTKELPSLVVAPKKAQDMLKLVSGWAGDALAYANNEAFARYCEKFEGDFKATMTAHFYTKPNAQGTTTEWWTYSTDIAGKLTLRYPKDAQGKAVALSGQIEGGATHFTYKEDVWNDQVYGNIAKGGFVRTKDVAPVAFDDAKGGFINSLSSPTSFFIPIHGQMVDGKINFTMDAARSDFNLSVVKAHSFYVVVAPTTLMLPVLGHFDLPYTDAHFILDHVVKEDFAVTRSGKSMSIERVATKEFPANQNKAVYTISLKACNPGCSAP